MKHDYLSLLRGGSPLSLSQQIRLIFQLSVPAILAQLSSIMMSYIDASMVGRLGAADSASIGLVASTTWLVYGICFAASMGFTVQASHLIGAKNEKEARNILKIAFITTVLFSLFLTAICLALCNSLPCWLGATEEIYEGARIYFLVFCVSIPVCQISDLAEGMLQSSGEMKIPSILQVLMGVLNVIFNYIFIFRMQMGIFGAALGTLISRIIIASLLCFFLFVRSPALRLRKNEKIFIKKEYFKNAFKIGFPVAFQQFVLNMGRIAFTKIVSPLGKIAIAANSFGITAESLCYMPAYGISVAATTLTGQSYGAKRYDMIQKLSSLTTIIGFLLMILAGGLMFIFAPQMIGFLSPDAEIQELGARILRIESFSEPFYGSSMIIAGALRGVGDTLVPSLLNFFSMWFIRIPLAFLLRKNYGLEGIWFAMSFELTVLGILFIVRLVRKNRKSKNSKTPADEPIFNQT